MARVDVMLDGQLNIVHMELQKANYVHKTKSCK